MKSGDRTALPFLFADNRSTANTQIAQNQKQHETIHFKDLPRFRRGRNEQFLHPQQRNE